MKAEYGKLPIADEGFRGMGYSNHVTGRVLIGPPDAIMENWEDDCKTMQENMIIGDYSNMVR